MIPYADEFHLRRLDSAMTSLESVDEDGAVLISSVAPGVAIALLRRVGGTAPHYDLDAFFWGRTTKVTKHRAFRVLDAATPAPVLRLIQGAALAWLDERGWDESLHQPISVVTSAEWVSGTEPIRDALAVLATHQSELVKSIADKADWPALRYLADTACRYASFVVAPTRDA